MDQALTPEQVSQILQIGKRTTLSLIRSGEIPARKVGGQWRVSPAALKEYFRGDVDDEPLNAADLVAIREGIEAIRRGETVSLEEYERERGL